jgi:hypothetical protein
MISLQLNELRRMEGVYLHGPADVSRVKRVESELGLSLPEEHREILLCSNGVEAYGGHLRLFGAYSTESIDITIWNDPNYWKFAWGDRCSGYCCFGETGWGDQYAYSYESLRSGAAKVHYVDALSMRVEVVASSFAEFFEKEFLRVAKEPYDVMTKLARDRLGILEATSHVVYVPSSLLTGTEDIGHVQKMNARSAMICNGDVALQLDAGPPDGTVKTVEAYEDDLRRTRLRLVWD